VTPSALVSRFGPTAAILFGFTLLAVTTSKGLGRMTNVLAARCDPLAPVARAEPVAVPKSSAVAIATSSDAVAAPVAGSLTPEQLEQDTKVRLREVAHAAFSVQHAAYRTACYDPQKAVTTRDRGTAFDVELGFDAAGRETSRKLVRTGPPSPNVEACVQGVKQPPVSIPAPGAAVTVSVPMTVP
jgi:hypothetical protein